MRRVRRLPSAARGRDSSIPACDCEARAPPADALHAVQRVMARRRRASLFGWVEYRAMRWRGACPLFRSRRGIRRLAEAHVDASPSTSTPEFDSAPKRKGPVCERLAAAAATRCHSLFLDGDPVGQSRVDVHPFIGFYTLPDQWPGSGGASYTPVTTPAAAVMGPNSNSLRAGKSFSPRGYGGDVSRETETRNRGPVAAPCGSADDCSREPCVSGRHRDACCTLRVY